MIGIPIFYPYLPMSDEKIYSTTAFETQESHELSKFVIKVVHKLC